MKLRIKSFASFFLYNEVLIMQSNIKFMKYFPEVG